MAGINIEMPAFEADDLLDAQARRRLVSYLYRLAEQVKYLAGHIDGDNVTEEFRQEMVSTASAKARDEISGTLTEYETQIEQNAREILTKASQTEVNALGEEIETASSQFSQTAEQLSTRVSSAEGVASQAQQTANGFSARITGAESTASSASSTASSARSTANSANARVAELELTLDGLLLSIDNNRLTFTANGLTIKNAIGRTVFAQDNSTGNLTITGNINASGGTIGGFTIGENSITGPNGVELYSTGSFSTVNNLWLGSGTDVFGNSYALVSQASGYEELRLGCATGDASSCGIRLYSLYGTRTVAMNYPLSVTAGLYLLNLPTTSASPNLYMDASGQVYRCV